MTDSDRGMPAVRPYKVDMIDVTKRLLDISEANSEKLGEVSERLVRVETNQHQNAEIRAEIGGLRTGFATLTTAFATMTARLESEDRHSRETHTGQQMRASDVEGKLSAMALDIAAIKLTGASVNLAALKTDVEAIKSDRSKVGGIVLTISIIVPMAIAFGGWLLRLAHITT